MVGLAVFGCWGHWIAPKACVAACFVLNCEARARHLFLHMPTDGAGRAPPRSYDAPSRLKRTVWMATAAQVPCSRVCHRQVAGTP